MVSLITPTHKPTYLYRLYDSIKNQTCKGFEWVICPNGNVDLSFLPKEDWIRIVPYEGDNKNIGAIKNFAFNQGKGDWLVEVDHDDEILPNCVEEIIKAANENNCTFIFSDSLDILSDGKSNIFNTDNGWVTYPFVYKGTEQFVNRTFIHTPQSVSRIWFAPNHVRAWKRDFYVHVGGHDNTLKALDDQDLLCRTYIYGTMHKIEKPLYAYYYHENNSFASQELNAWIQDYTLVLYEKYIRQMMEKWCSEKGLAKLDISKRLTNRPGYFSIDLDKDTLPDNSVGLIFAEDALQLYKSPIDVMHKCWKLLASGGMLLTNTPSTDGRGAYQDPNHVSFWNSNSFWYYTKAQFSHFTNTPIRFQATHIRDWYPSDFHKTYKIDYVIAHLTALKDGNERSWLPGHIEI